MCYSAHVTYISHVRHIPPIEPRTSQMKRVCVCCGLTLPSPFIGLTLPSSLIHMSASRTYSSRATEESTQITSRTLKNEYIWEFSANFCSNTSKCTHHVWKNYEAKALLTNNLKAHHYSLLILSKHVIFE